MTSSLRQGPRVKPKTDGQKRYIEAIFRPRPDLLPRPGRDRQDLSRRRGGRQLLKQGKAQRIVLARPAVEAGERLGFLPGDLQAKVNPYLRPLFDALHDMMDFEQVKRFMVNDVIEVIPLAFMRGRTLNDSVIILDEAQNTTASQMLMFLTRLGHDSQDDRHRRHHPGRPARGNPQRTGRLPPRSSAASRESP